MIAHIDPLIAVLDGPAVPSRGLAEGSTSGRRTTDKDGVHPAPDGAINHEPEASGVHPQERPSPAIDTPTSTPETERASLGTGDELLGGRFVIRERIGRGGMGVVYSAFDRERRGMVALKTLDHVNAFARNRLKDEFRVLADVVHPNLAELYGLFSDADLYFFTMELVSGRTFRQHVLGQAPTAAHFATTMSGQATAGPRTPGSRKSHPAGTTTTVDISPPSHVTDTHIGQLTHEAVRDLFAQLAQGVHAIHESGKLHRDLKPPNVLVTDAGRVVVLDFGLVRDLPDGTRSVSAGLYAFPENPGMVWGTPEFMAPEQAAGRETTRASDWYAFGVMFYEVLTGQLPFVGDSEFVMTQKRLSAAPDPQWFASNLPSDLAQLCAQLLSIEPTRRPDFSQIMRVLRPNDALETLETIATQARSMLGQSSNTFLLGRDAELDILQRAFDQVRSGQPALVWIEAPSGMGKTALAQEFVTRLRLCEDVAILTGRCHEREQLPYKALDTVVDQLARYLRGLSEARLEQITPDDVTDLVRAFGALGTVFPQAEPPVIDEPTGQDARDSRRRAFKAFKTLLARVARLRPLVLFIDDLQWGDLDSVRLLEELLTQPERPPFLLIGAYRSEERTTQPFLREITEELPARVGIVAERIALKPLADHVALELAYALMPTTEGRAHVRTIVRESAGNPFFLEALVQHRAELGPASSAASDVSVDALVRQRCAHLPPAARRLLSVLAVAGQPIEQQCAFDAAGLTTESHAAVAALRNGRFVRTRPGLTADEIEPYHDRVRESVHASLGPDELRAHHASLAHVLEQTGRAEPELLSRHLYGAGELRRAADFAIVAADHAARAFAFDRAAEFYRRALDYFPGDRTHQRGLQMRLGDVLAHAGRGAQAASQLMEAAEGLSGYDALQLQRRAAEQWLASGRIQEGMAVLRSVVRAVDLSMPETPARALAELLLLRTQLRLRGTKFKSRPADQIPRTELLRIDSCKAAAWSLGVVDQIHGALFQTKHLLLSLKVGEPSRVGISLATQGMYLAGEGAPRERVERLFAQADNLLVGNDDPYLKAVMHSSRGTAAALFADYSLARIELQQAEEIFRGQCKDALGEANTTRLFWAAALSYLGRWRELNERLEGWMGDAAERGDIYAATTLRLNEVSTLLWLAADDPETARRDVQDAMAGWPHRGDSVQGFFSRLLPVYIELYVGDTRAATRRLLELQPAFYRSLLSRLKGLRSPFELLAGLCHLGMLKEGHGDRKLHRAGLRRHLAYLEGDSIAYSGVFASMLRAGQVAYEESPAASVPVLQEAIARSEALRMAMIGACLRDRLGRVVGGEQGRALIEAAGTVFTAEGVRRPESLVAMYLSNR